MARATFEPKDETKRRLRPPEVLNQGAGRSQWLKTALVGKGFFVEKELQVQPLVLLAADKLLVLPTLCLVCFFGGRGVWVIMGLASSGKGKTALVGKGFFVEKELQVQPLVFLASDKLLVLPTLCLVCCFEGRGGLGYYGTRE